MKPFIAGIAGGSCSGKTHLAGSVAAGLGGLEAIVVPVDAYYFDLSHLSPEERGAHNFDHPDSVDFGLLMKHLKLLRAGEEVLIPVYDYVTHTRAPRDKWVMRLLSGAAGMRPVVIVEGLHALYRENIRTLMDLAVFVDCDPGTCLERRIERDVRERGRTRENVLEQWERTVVPMYRRHVEPMREFAGLVIDGSRPVDESAKTVLEVLLPLLQLP